MTDRLVISSRPGLYIKRGRSSQVWKVFCFLICFSWEAHFWNASVYDLGQWGWRWLCRGRVPVRLSACLCARTFSLCSFLLTSTFCFHRNAGTDPRVGARQRCLCHPNDVKVREKTNIYLDVSPETCPSRVIVCLSLCTSGTWTPP